MQTDDDAERMGGLLRGYFVAQAIYVAARLGVADLLGRAEEVGMDLDALAAVTGSHAGALYRVMRALASEGIFAEREGRRFVLTGMGSLLKSDGGDGGTSLRAAALLAGETQYKVWALFKDSVKHGTPAFDRIFRQPLFPFLEGHPEFHAIFNQAMSQQVERVKAAAVAACDVRAGETVVDVGGGRGALLAAVLERNPEARGVLLESAAVVAEAREAMAGLPCAGRVAFCAGSFFSAGEIPAGDVLILASILHMYQDEEAGQILRNCRRAMRVGGRIYLVGRVLKGANESDAGKWEDLNMLVMTGGRERTFEEYVSLLTAAGFAGATHVDDAIVRAGVG